MYEDDTGLIYMRARYYCPTLRRFVNADVIAGSIDNSATLNRYAFVNGNPAVNVDPMGLSAERGNNPYGDIYRAYFGSEYHTISADNIYKYAKANNKQMVLIDAFGKIIGYLPSILSITEGMSYNIPLPFNGNASFSVVANGGNGDINISAICSDQIELAKTFSFRTEGAQITYSDSDIVMGIEYSCDINEYTNISASVSVIPKTSLSAEYSITTECGDNNSVTTSMEITYYDKPQSPKPRGQRHTSLSTSSDASTAAVLIGMGLAGAAASAARSKSSKRTGGMNNTEEKAFAFA